MPVIQNLFIQDVRIVLFGQGRRKAIKIFMWVLLFKSFRGYNQTLNLIFSQKDLNWDNKYQFWKITKKWGVIIGQNHPIPKKECLFPMTRSTLLETFLHPVLEKIGKFSLKNGRSSRIAFTSAGVTEAPDAAISRTIH